MCLCMLQMHNEFLIAIPAQYTAGTQVMDIQAEGFHIVTHLSLIHILIGYNDTHQYPAADKNRYKQIYVMVFLEKPMIALPLF